MSRARACDSWGRGTAASSTEKGSLFLRAHPLVTRSRRYTWFQEMMSLVVRNRLRPASDTNVKLCNVKSKHARTIGGGLASAIVSNLTVEAAVDEWVARYPAMAELDRE